MKTPETFDVPKEAPLSPEQREQIAALEIAFQKEEEDVARDIKRGGLTGTWWEKNYSNTERGIGNIF